MGGHLQKRRIVEQMENVVKNQALSLIDKTSVPVENDRRTI
jgi:hypothetical protein